MRVRANLLDDILELIDRSSIRRGPGAPLLAIDRPELAIFIGPFIPDAHAILVQIAHVGLATDKPEKLVDDRSSVNLAIGQQWKARSQVKAHLVSE